MVRSFVLACTALAMGCASPEEREEDEACDKVDILFVVDNSGSMGDNQQNLVNNFGKFADSIKTTLGQDIDYHVGVVTSDAYSGNDPSCQSVGALVTQTGGAEASGRVCGPFKQGRFLSKDDPLTTSFQCIAQVGSSGAASEDVIGAAAAALAPALNAAGGCNAGFVRPDSLLVLVLVTDEDTVTGEEQVKQLFAELGSAVGVGSGPENLPKVWKEKIAVQSGHPSDATVVVTLAKGVPGNVCAADEQGSDGKTLMAFTSQYTYNFIGDICAPDYGDVLVRALQPVASACNDYSVNMSASGDSDEGSSCAQEGPGAQDWLFSSLAVVGASVLMSAVGLGTLSRSMARNGNRQSASNQAGIGLGLLVGGGVGIGVAVIRECGIGSAIGWLGIAVSCIGLAMLVLGMATGRSER